MTEFKPGDKVVCCRGVEGSCYLFREPLKTGVRYTIEQVFDNSGEVVVKGIAPAYNADRFVKIEDHE
jgi:hypothetical protein